MWQFVVHTINQTHDNGPKSPTFPATKLENGNPKLHKLWGGSANRASKTTAVWKLRRDGCGNFSRFYRLFF
jgi:hypothetical protein